MPRGPRNAPGGVIYHVLNRGVGRQTLFFKDGDFAAFQRIMAEGLNRIPMRVLGYTLMTNHWHMVLWPAADGQLTAYLRWITNTHTQRWRAHYHNAGLGHVYQGRFKGFPVQDDPHLLIVCRYVERNAPRANLVNRAEDWPWSSLWQRQRGQHPVALADWPVERPADWVQWVNEPQSQAELDALRHSLRRSSPFGEPGWQQQIALRLGLEATLRPQGRPRKAPEAVQA
jgi:putative transposase